MGANPSQFGRPGLGRNLRHFDITEKESMVNGQRSAGSNQNDVKSMGLVSLRSDREPTLSDASCAFAGTGGALLGRPPVVDAWAVLLRNSI